VQQSVKTGLVVDDCVSGSDPTGIVDNRDIV
jgi:hypothetical protein